MSRKDKDEKTLAIAMALAAFVVVYLLGLLALFVLDSMIGFGKGVADVLGTLLLLSSSFAGAALLRQIGRRA